MATQTATARRVARSLAADAAGLSDRELLRRFAADRDQAAFAAVVARHTAMVLGVCRRTLPRSCDPEDACQAVFLLLAQKAARVRWQASAAGWLYTAARKVARNARVAAGRRARRESRAAVPEAVPPADPMTGRELAAVLDEELDRLPPRYRDPLVLCYLEGLTRDEAAARLGVPEETLKSQVKRGRKKLADALSARGWELGVVLLAVVTTSTGAASRALRDSILAAEAGAPSPAATALARGAAMNPLRTHAKSVLLVAAGVAALGLGIFQVLPTSAQPPKGGGAPAADKVEQPAQTRFGGGRFRAARAINDARYSPDGRLIVGISGSMVYVWDAGDGSVVRTIDTKLGLPDDPTKRDEPELAFAVHPKERRVACGGVQDGKTYLWVWDYATGKFLAETESAYDALKVLAWTPDGTRLLERANVGWEKPTAWKLIVRDASLAEVRAHDLPKDFGESATVMHPLPGNKEVILWQGGRDPTVVDLESGAVVRTIRYQPGLPSDFATSADGKTLIATGSTGLCLFDAATGEELRQLPVLRGGWYKPRPLFSPDGKTVYVWDHRPIAYEVATGKERWKATFRTVHTVRMRLCDVSPDGTTVLARHGHALARIDARTGTERDPPDGPAHPPTVVWSPDGRRLFVRAERHDRTWTAWDAATGKRLFDLLPTGLVADDNWKMMPDLFFIRGGKEIVAGVVLAESTERSGPTELLVFDAATGKGLRRLGAPLPRDLFQWSHLVAVDPDGSAVVLQSYTIDARPGPGGIMQLDYDKEYRFKTVRWDPVKQAKLGEWDVVGNRTEPPRHYAPYSVTIGTTQPDPNPGAKKPDPAKVRLFSLADGKRVCELATEFTTLDADRLQGSFLLTEGHDSKWVSNGRTIRYTPQPPIAYDLWELPARDKVRVFGLDAKATVSLGPAGRYVLRVVDDHAVEVYEPFVLKKAVARVAALDRVQSFEFSPDGSRVAVSLADASVVIWDTAPWRARMAEQIAREVPADLASLWDDLARDSAAGLRAARLLSAAGDKGVALLAEKMAARKGPDEARVKRWVADLDAPRFAARERAEKDLRELGPQAEPFLRAELKRRPTAEAKERITKLLADIDAAKPTPALNRERRAVQALAWTDTPAARALLAKWAEGDPSADLTKAARAAVR
jgi:RNA polymerase sigma factor (sigma-70 family)